MLGEPDTRNTVTYGVISSQRIVDAVTYDIVRILSKSIKTSHISQHYLPHIDRDSIFHNAMQSAVVIWLSVFFKCLTFANAVKATWQKVDLSRRLTYNVGS